MKSEGLLIGYKNAEGVFYVLVTHGRRKLYWIELWIKSKIRMVCN